MADHVLVKLVAVLVKHLSQWWGSCKLDPFSQSPWVLESFYWPNKESIRGSL